MLFRISCLDHVIADPIIEVEDDETSDSETGTKHYSQAGCVSNAFVIFHYACLGVFCHGLCIYVSGRPPW